MKISPPEPSPSVAAPAVAPFWIMITGDETTILPAGPVLLACALPLNPVGASPEIPVPMPSRTIVSVAFTSRVPLPSLKVPTLNCAPSESRMVEADAVKLPLMPTLGAVSI